MTTVESGMARLSKWLLKCLCAIVALQISSVTGQSGEEATIEEGEVTNFFIIFLRSIFSIIIKVTTSGEEGSTTASGDYYYYEV